LIDYDSKKTNSIYIIFTFSAMSKYSEDAGAFGLLFIVLWSCCTFFLFDWCECLQILFW